MFLPIVYFCTTTRSGRFGQVIVDTVKFLLPIATRNLPTSVNINLNASVKKISAIGCARHQIDQSIKFPQSFCSVNNNIVCDLSGYALFASLDCIVRDRLSRKASINSINGISKDSATRSKVSRLGVFNPLNHRDQLVIATPVRVAKSLYESSKKYSLFLWLKAYITVIMSLFVYKFVNESVNVSYVVNLAQITKHLYHQMLVKTDIPKRREDFSQTYDYYTKHRGRSPSPSFSVRPYAALGGAVR